MKARTLCLYVTFACNAWSVAAPPKQVFEYLKPILEREGTSAGDIWEAAGSGGYVLRFDLDVTGDGLPEMFLTSTLDMVKQSSVWKAYKAQPDGYAPYAQVQKEGLSLYATEIWVEQIGNSLAFVSWGHDRFGVDSFNWYLVRYLFDDRGIVSTRALSTEEEINALRASGRLTRIEPTVYGVLLADLLSNQDVAWKRIDFKSQGPSPNGYYIAAEDGEKIRSLTNFTPTVAMKELQALVRDVSVAAKTPGENVSRTFNSQVPSAVATTDSTVEPNYIPNSAASPSPFNDRRHLAILLTLLGVVAVLAIRLLGWKRH